VRVRIILDDINAAGRDEAIARLAAHPNVQVRIYNPTAARQGFRGSSASSATFPA
jgi:putative cardiolipin synthase